MPWLQPGDKSDPLAEASQAGLPVPVAWLGRTSTDDQQDPSLSLPRQLRKSREALPSGYVIVAHFYDVESGRKELDERGYSRAHEQFDIAIPRDGGIQDLLVEAARPDRRFVAVICEEIGRVARRTYYGTKIEHELEQHGVPLLAANEPILPDIGNRGRSRKRAGPILTRRINQAIAEWYVVQMLELSWDGFCEHTEQGWNIGRPPYGYMAEKRPHPVPAKRAEGKTKTRLVPDPAKGPTVTTIFQLRALQRLGYDEIADRLNTDLASHPAPEPVDPRRAVGRWTGSAVRGILTNPKYTGYMVWNRRATKKGGRHNPVTEWVWSRQPTHEPLVTKELFEAASPVAQHRQGSRPTNAVSTHPQTKRSYRLRSYVSCDLCGRRMFGKTRHAIAYFACQPERQHHKGRADWFNDHPKSLWVREDVLLDGVRHFFAERIFGPRRREHLSDQLRRSGAKRADSTNTKRRKQITRELTDLQRRQDNLIGQLETFESTGDPEADRDYRQSIQRRFAELTAARRTKQAELDQLNTDTPPAGDDADLLDLIPQLPLELSDLPEDLERRLYDAFHLEIRYNRPRHEATFRVTVREDTVKLLTNSTESITERGSDMKREQDRQHGRLFPSSGCPLQDSNLRTRLRRPLLYPLS
ncbi:recombinase family protein [Actinomadura miaoliensis]|uniref:Recombinase family protein n=1 Tax=Actinomadura miaoliensis TaxID=430685 RepID=A0ABP7WZA6_9ACTN